ncbi:MAG: lamin tail domain-containing protein [Marinicellaceae bacterium]
MKILNTALLLFVIAMISYKSEAGTNDLIYKSSFEQLFFVGGNTTTSNVVLKLNQFEEYTAPNIGAYVIPYPIENGTNFNVDVVEFPDGNLCSAQNRTGFIANDDVDNVDVSCGIITTIYDVKQENVTGFVAIENLIVTQCKPSDGYWVQTIPGDDDYIGDNFSGSYVNKSDAICSGVDAEVKVGDRVTLNPAQANEFFGQIQMSHLSLTVLSSDNELPEPVNTSVSSLASINAVPLEGVLVRVNNLIVSDVQTPPGIAESSPSNTFEVNNQLLVDDVFYLTQPFPEINDDFATITGISIFRNGLSKLLPRYSQDVYFSTDGVTNLVINEVDYNQPGLDQNEFVEIMNPTNDPISLNGVTLYFINGSNNTDYAQIDLTTQGSLLAGQYLVVGSSNMIDNVANGALTIEFEELENQIQNSNPEGIVLFNTNTNSVIDSLSYGGDIPTATLTDINRVVNVTENSSSVSDNASNDGSIARVPNGLDRNLNDQDFKFTAVSTPGSYNQLVTTPELLVINEFDYNTPGTDDREFIEIFNPSESDISLINVSLYLINGSNNTEYAQIELDSLVSIQAGQYLVIGSSNMINSVVDGALTIEFENPESQIQNSDPEGMVLFDKNTNTVIDSLSYGSTIAMATLTDLGIMVSVTEGSATATDTNSPDGSIARIPNGEDTDNNGFDFSFTTTLSPGAENINTN